MVYKIWDNQHEHYAENSCSLHCCSQWVIDARTGEILNIVTEISSGEISIEENPSYYFKGTKIVKEKRYVLHEKI